MQLNTMWNLEQGMKTNNGHSHKIWWNVNKICTTKLLKIEEGGRGISQSGAMWEGLNLPFLALKMEKKGYEPRDVGRL